MLYVVAMVSADSALGDVGVGWAWRPVAEEAQAAGVVIPETPWSPVW